MKNNIINELRFASKKKKNAVLGYVYCDYLLDMFEEIERLNNIINELENWLAKEYISGCYEELYRIGLQDSYDKLQELKDSDKE